MMEIKVRAWDNHEKRWAKTHEIEGELFINPEADDTGVFYIHDKSASGKLHYTLVRSTGLKDKNGKEVWEGDRLLCEGRLTNERKVRSNRTGKMIWCDLHHGFCIVLQNKDGEWEYPAMISYVPEKLEVIGNIYGVDN